MPRPDPTNFPGAERLAAYDEGTLPLDERAWVEAWLADHPEYAAELDAPPRWQRWFQLAAPPEPSEAVWSSVLERIEQDVRHAGEPRRIERGRRWRAGIAALGTVAAGILLLLVPRPGTMPVPVAAEEAFPVASAEEVEIHSVAVADAGALVVGEPPLPVPIVLMAAGDATLKKIEADPGGRRPEVRMPASGEESPMIVAPFLASVMPAP
jgi:anti-sigma factor RsiW